MQVLETGLHLPERIIVGDSQRTVSTVSHGLGIIGQIQAPSIQIERSYVCLFVRSFVISSVRVCVALGGSTK